MTIPGLVRANNLNDVVDRERAWDNLGSSLATGDIAIPAPSLDLNFAANKSLVDDISGNNLITFSRASTGTFVGSNGLIQTAASGVPRFDHNPTTGESLGLLVEEARTNLNPESSLYQSWIYNMSPSPSPQNNQGTAPDGTNTAWWMPSGSTGTAQSNYGIAANTATYSWSIYVKALSSGSKVYFSLNGVFDVNTSISTFDFDTATFSNASNGTVTRLANGWFRLTQTFTNNGSGTIFLLRLAADPLTNGRVLFWGSQLEVGAFPSSYIPTSGATGTRAADVASMTGTNFSSWYNASNVFSTYCEYISVSRVNGIAYYIGDAIDSNRALQLYDSTNFSLFEFNTSPNVSFSTIKGATVKTAFGRENGNNTGAASGVIVGSSAGSVSVVPTQLSIGGNTSYSNRYLGSTIKRFTYWPTRLYNQALQYITQPSTNSFNLYAFNYAINGKDILALNAVRNASTRNFIFIKGLLSAAQPRLTTAAASTSSALTLATNALPKLSPTSSGNYFFASGITLSGVTTRINGTNALSIATSPFSGSTATAPLLFRELRPQANWRFTEPMPSGTIASPEFAIPFETNDFVLFMKAGPN